MLTDVIPSKTVCTPTLHILRLSVVLLSVLLIFVSMLISLYDSF